MDVVYSLLSSLYGDELHDFLLGVNGQNDTNLFNVMFIVLVIISMGIIPGWYYKMWDRATWAPIGKWLLILLANAVIIFLINVIWVYCLKDKMVDEDELELSIGFSNFVGFGFASAIIASFGFFLASLGWKTQSINVRSTPF